MTGRVMSFRPRLFGVACSWLGLAFLPACLGSSDERPACLSAVDVDACAPLYPPEFPVIYGQVLSVTCASPGVSCHGVNGRQGDLNLADESTAYDALVGSDGGKARVKPGDPSCSEMMVRLDAGGHAWSMPPGAPLDARARCSIRRWIAAGAPRTGGGP